MCTRRSQRPRIAADGRSGIEHDQQRGGALEPDTGNEDTVFREGEGYFDMSVKTASDGRLLYLDKKRSQAAFAGVPAANSLAAMQGGDFTTNIRNFIAGVKWEKSGAASYTSAKPDGETSFSRAYKAAPYGYRYDTTMLSRCRAARATKHSMQSL